MKKKLTDKELLKRLEALPIPKFKGRSENESDNEILEAYLEYVYKVRRKTSIENWFNYLNWCRGNTNVIKISYNPDKEPIKGHLPTKIIKDDQETK